MLNVLCFVLPSSSKKKVGKGWVAGGVALVGKEGREGAEGEGREERRVGGIDEKKTSVPFRSCNRLSARIRVLFLWAFERCFLPPSLTLP